MSRRNNRQHPAPEPMKIAGRVSVADAAAKALAEDQEARRALHAPPDAGTVTVPSMDSFVNLAHKIGMGADNPLSGSRYTLNPMTRNRTELEFAYRGNWVCGLACDIIADDMTREGVEFSGNLPSSEIERMEAVAMGMQLWERTADVIRWSRLYGGAIGVVMIDGQNPREPLRLDAIPANSYRGIIVFDRWQVDATLDDLVTEQGPDIGLPKYYRVNQAAPAMKGMAIHHSRVAFRLLGLPLPYQQSLSENLWGCSVLERLEDRLKGFDAATLGAAQLVYKAWLRVFKVKGFKEVAAGSDSARNGLAAYVDLMRRFQGIEGVSVMDMEDEMQVLQHSAFSGLAEVVIHLGQQVSGALQIPLVRFFGQSPAGLNSSGDSDLATYNDNIRKEQKRNIRRGILLNYVLIAASKRIELPDGFGFTFRGLWQLKDSEKPTVAKTTVDAVVTALDANLITQRAGMEELRQSASLTGIFSNITQADIDAADDTLATPGLGELMSGVAPGLENSAPTDPGAAPPALPGGEDNGNPENVIVHHPDRKVFIHMNGDDPSAGGATQ